MFDLALVAFLPDRFVEAAMAFLVQYGYLALLLFVFAETSLLFPFLPSELVVPAAAALLVTGPVSFLVFVLAAAIGGLAGSLVAYYAFGTGSSRLLDRLDSRIHVSESEIERARGWFRRWGDSAVFWGRLLPGVRSLISIPAGFAGMDVGKFALYSGAGNGLFAACVAALVFFGADGRPVDFLVSVARPLVTAGVAFARSAPVLAIAAVMLGLFGVLLVRNAYAAYRSSP